MRVLPSQVFEEDAILMGDMLTVFAEEMKIRMKDQEEMKRMMR